MSGGLFVTALLQESGAPLSAEQIRDLDFAHGQAFERWRETVRAIPGARQLLDALTDHDVPWTIATSGLAVTARPSLELLGLPADHP